MLSLLGTKRAFLLVLLASINVVVAAGLYFLVIPFREQADKDLAKITSDLKARENQVSQMRQDFSTLKTQISVYRQLERQGFFGEQDRNLARDAFKQVEKRSRLNKAAYTVKPAAVEAIREADEFGYSVLKSPITVKVEAVDDLDVFAFLYLMQTNFPGWVNVRSFDIKRKADLNEAALRSIGLGQPTVLIDGEAEFEWRTMASRKDLGLDGAAPQGGAQ